MFYQINVKDNFPVHIKIIHEPNKNLQKNYRASAFLSTLSMAIKSDQLTDLPNLALAKTAINHIQNRLNRRFLYRFMSFFGSWTEAGRFQKLIENVRKEIVNKENQLKSRTTSLLATDKPSPEFTTIITKNPCLAASTTTQVVNNKCSESINEITTPLAVQTVNHNSQLLALDTVAGKENSVETDKNALENKVIPLKEGDNSKNTTKEVSSKEENNNGDKPANVNECINEDLINETESSTEESDDFDSELSDDDLEFSGIRKSKNETENNQTDPFAYFEVKPKTLHQIETNRLSGYQYKNKFYYIIPYYFDQQGKICEEGNSGPNNSTVVEVNIEYNPKINMIRFTSDPVKVRAFQYANVLANQRTNVDYIQVIFDHLIKNQ